MNDSAVLQLLTDLIAIPTVNPMGRPRETGVPVERPAIEYLERWLQPLGVSTERQRCSPLHESLLIVVPGKTSGPATLFESHLDTVPAEDWPDRAFQPRVDGDTVYGRGACDDKGPLAAMLLALRQVLESGQQPPQTVLLLAAGDEEYGQTGIKHFVSSNRAALGRGIFGEPTQCLPLVQHKGTIRWDITARGRSAHTSRAELGRNAIVDMLRVVQRLGELQDDFRRRFTSSLLTGPSLTVTQIHGGRTRNAVPDECTIAVDFRILPTMDRQQASSEVRGALDALGLELTHSDFQCYTRGLNTPPDHPFAQVVLAACRRHLGREVQVIGEPFGSDASWMPESGTAVVLGPGDIRAAHAIDESVDLKQVTACVNIYRDLMLHDWS